MWERLPPFGSQHIQTYKQMVSKTKVKKNGRNKKVGTNEEAFIWCVRQVGWPVARVLAGFSTKSLTSREPLSPRQSGMVMHPFVWARTWLHLLLCPQNYLTAHQVLHTQIYWMKKEVFVAVLYCCYIILEFPLQPGAERMRSWRPFKGGKREAMA